ncbi:MAG TPA: N-acetylmuramoyl-L-alanine amidase [Rhodopila sp.]|uniref:N-acetylmuramoyl-L-alanine amidase family protein n=1 Tax=Rhodopila sp. TaxID=2480087 RepID=UPI002BFE0265|nr:N-acetylmuramoyl-L-alanine amidase [Rhodopila sp.]HVY17677.1 N-acetylmuramoyl-L-alanine amidase [Rhodopila sp.]
MFPVRTITRRVLLRRFAQASPVCATFLLPPSAEAVARSLRGHARGGVHHPIPERLPIPPMPPAVRPAPRDSGPIVMLDPGHGGKDPGAIGVTGTYEKQVALATALELKHLLEFGGYRVVLTRTRDRFIPLEDRVALAQDHGAALFVSMHADALSDHSVRGASVYTNAVDASDPQTAALAQRENSADRFVRGRRHAGGVAIEAVIANLVRQDTLVRSGRIAQTLVSSLDDSLPMLTNPERHAGFVVLQSASIPSVLVEMGFMSNRRDEAALRTPAHRRLVAQAMRRAVDMYFQGGDQSA